MNELATTQVEHLVETIGVKRLPNGGYRLYLNGQPFPYCIADGGVELVRHGDRYTRLELSLIVDEFPTDGRVWEVVK